LKNFLEFFEKNLENFLKIFGKLKIFFWIFIYFLKFLNFFLKFFLKFFSQLVNNINISHDDIILSAQHFVENGKNLKRDFCDELNLD